MATNADAIKDLEASKKTFEDQCNDASGATLLKLLTAIQHLADEVGDLEARLLATADYVPQTDSFKAVTDDGKAFLSLLTNLKTLFAGIGQVAAAADKIVSFIK
jgi:hypothetical protein